MLVIESNIYALLQADAVDRFQVLLNRDWKCFQNLVCAPAVRAYVQVRLQMCIIRIRFSTRLLVRDINVERRVANMYEFLNGLCRTSAEVQLRCANPTE